MDENLLYLNELVLACFLISYIVRSDALIL